MKKIVFLTGAGMSAESGFSTFRDSDGLWEQYPVEKVATPEGWQADPTLVTNFYNQLRRQLVKAQPNAGHRLIAQLEEHFQVSVVTQNVDNLHERAGSTRVIHLHGELMKACSSRCPDDPRSLVTLPADHPDITPGQRAADGSLLRPFIVFFGEAVPRMTDACREAEQADIFVIVGTSLNVYPAAGLLYSVPPEAHVYLIDPKPVDTHSARPVTTLACTASEGMERLLQLPDFQP